MFYTGFFLRLTYVVVVFTCVLVCDAIVVAQWRRLICFTREAYAYVCCFSRCLTYAIKWACSAVAGMVICRDNKLDFNEGWEEIAYLKTPYTWKLPLSVTLLTNVTCICSVFQYCAFLTLGMHKAGGLTCSDSACQILSILGVWINFLGSRDLEQVSSFWAAFEQNVGSEETKSRQKNFTENVCLCEFLEYLINFSKFRHITRHLISARLERNDVFCSV